MDSEFDWKWANHQDKTQPLIYDVGTESGKIALWCGIGLVILLIIIFVGSALNLIELQ